MFFWYLEFYTFPPALRFCRLLIGATELTGVKIFEIRSLSCRFGVLETFLFVILIHGRFLISRVLYISSCAALLQAPHW